MKAFARVKLRLHSFLTSTPDEGEWSGYALAVLSGGKEVLVPMNKTFFEPNCWYRHFEEEKNNNERRTWKETVVSSIEPNNLEMFPD